MKYDSIVVGCGFAGAVAARELSERGGQKVLVIEKRDHVAGNCYDSPDSNGILIHRYGPHIFHTGIKLVYNYLSRFTEWIDYQHEVEADVHGRRIPVPFNLNTLYMVYDREKAERLEKKLIAAYGEDTRVPILSLMNQDDDELKSVADYVYENIFLKYTMKQWGQKPEDIDPEVTGRVPVLISRDNRYFQDPWQGIPLHGYTDLVKKMVSCQGIELCLGQDAKERITVCDGRILFDGEEYYGNVIFTGPLDEFFGCCFGRLPYRSLHFELEQLKQDSCQDKAVVNYTVSEEYTRITEFKKMTKQEVPGNTTIMKEYPMAYLDSTTQIPYYAILNDKNDALHKRYLELVSKCPRFYTVGRLAEYKYYDMDDAIDSALNAVGREFTE